MSNFIKFRDAVNAQIKTMEKSKSGLFLSHVNKTEVWDTYLDAFPEGSDPIYIENTVHDCNCCKDFIRDLGRAVSIDSKNNIVTCWDINIDDEVYQGVADALAEYVRKQSIASAYKASSFTLDRKENKGQLDDKALTTFSHFYFKLTQKYAPANNSAEVIGDSKNRFHVLKRGLTELSVDALETVISLIDDNNLYLGEQNLTKLKDFLSLKIKFDKVALKRQDNFIWSKIHLHPSVVMFKNSVIGTLVVDLSEGTNLDAAVASYENKVAPTNYKRSQSVVTKQMVESAQKKVEELGITDSLERRHAKLSDITINNVIWTDKATKAKLLNQSVFEDLIDDCQAEKKKPKNGIEIGLMDFIENVVPEAKSLQIYLEGKHNGNFVSLVSPVHKEAPNLVKWDNNVSWSYNGNMTDSVKARVQSKGGKVDGDLRVSLSWFNTDDLDIHMSLPESYRNLFHANRREGGFELDVDMNVSSFDASKNAVENISASNIKDIREGDYTVMVKNFTKRNTEDCGFDIEVEFLGEVYNFSTKNSPKDSQTVECFTFNYTKLGGIKFKDVELDTNSVSQEMWGLGTNNFHNVSSVMFSPNHWDENKVGNRHLFFMLDGCKNPEPVRGFYNEFIIDSLHKDRKVLEVLAGKMKAEYSEDQLSGIGFSTTKRGDNFIALVKGSAGNKVYNVVL